MRSAISQSSFYWSSITSVAFPTFAWIVIFTSGALTFDSKPSTIFVRAARGGP